MMRGRFTMFTWRFGEVHGWCSWVVDCHSKSPHTEPTTPEAFQQICRIPRNAWNFPIVFSAKIQQIGDRGACTWPVATLSIPLAAKERFKAWEMVCTDGKEDCLEDLEGFHPSFSHRSSADRFPYGLLSALNQLQQ